MMISLFSGGVCRACEPAVLLAEAEAHWCQADFNWLFKGLEEKKWNLKQAIEV